MICNKQPSQRITGYQKDGVKNIVTWCLVFMTGGFARLVLYWMPHWMLICCHRQCQIRDAVKVLLQVMSLLSFLQSVSEYSFILRTNMDRSLLKTFTGKGKKFSVATSIRIILNWYTLTTRKRDTFGAMRQTTLSSYST